MKNQFCEIFEFLSLRGISRYKGSKKSTQRIYELNDIEFRIKIRIKTIRKQIINWAKRSLCRVISGNPLPN